MRRAFSSLGSTRTSRSSVIRAWPSAASAWAPTTTNRTRWRVSETINAEKSGWRRGIFIVARAHRFEGGEALERRGGSRSLPDESSVIAQRAEGEGPRRVAHAQECASQPIAGQLACASYMSPHGAAAPAALASEGAPISRPAQSSSRANRRRWEAGSCTCTSTSTCTSTCTWARLPRALKTLPSVPRSLILTPCGHDCVGDAPLACSRGAARPRQAA